MSQEAPGRERRMKDEEIIIRTSVRALVEFILRSGDLDNRRGGWAEREAMAAGSRVHRKVQGRRGTGYQAEVPLRWQKKEETYTLVVEGRADGILTAGKKVMIEEIKGVYADLERIEEPVPVHLAQAMCYAWIYGSQNKLKKIRICMTYVSLETETEKKFMEEYTLEELRDWFMNLISEYERWSDFQVRWTKKRNESVHGLEFPFPYRKGQHELVVDIYRTILRKKQLFVQAPTGIGKTMSAVFPAVHALGEKKADKIFYLTARTITRTVVEEAFLILRAKGVSCKSITITVKEKMCILDEPDCNPASCPRAKGHFDRVNAAIFEMLTEGRDYTRETLQKQAEKWNVCPFEMQLDLSYFMDAVICDYNYVFDPNAKLKRYFGETGKVGDYLFIIDEAHNLVERGREMYSAQIFREDFLDAGKLAKDALARLDQTEVSGLPAGSEASLPDAVVLSAGTGEGMKAGAGATAERAVISAEAGGLSALASDGGSIPAAAAEAGRMSGPPAGRRKSRADEKERKRRQNLRYNLARMRKTLQKCSRIMLAYRKEQEAQENPGTGSGMERKSVSGGSLDSRGGNRFRRMYFKRTSVEGLFTQLVNLAAQTEAVLSDMREGEHRKSLLNFYFQISDFLNISDLLDENYVIYSAVTRQNRFLIRLFCVNPAQNLQNCLNRGISAVFLSATMLPVRYYMSLLSSRTDNYAVSIPSPFDRKNRLLLIGQDVSTLYTRRTAGEYEKIADYIYAAASARRGNYLAFFPSYQMLQNVSDIFSEKYPEEQTAVQEPYMEEKQREAFLQMFQSAPAEGSGRIGFCVMGGIFSEGIDLTGERLIGVIIVGTGIPQIGEERELLKNYYDRKNGSGFDYAYRIPGMNKVLQSAGRVIRTARDRGVILLLDSRFDMQENRRLFPADWREDVRLCSLNNVKDSLQDFWQTHKEKQNESDESGAYQQSICLPPDSDGCHSGN